MVQRILSRPVTPTGVGKADYSREVSLGQVRPGTALKYNQRLKMFVYTPQDLVPTPYIIPWIQPLLAPAATAHLMDLETGIPTPFTVPKGYTITVIEKSWDFNQDVELWLYFDGALVAAPGSSFGGTTVDITQIVGYSSVLFDPTAAAAHTVDVTIINRGGANMRGGVQFVAILEAVGTPPFPTEKKTRCPFCSHEQTVPVATTVIICGNCGKEYHVYSVGMVRRV